MDNNSPLENLKNEYEMLSQRQRIQQNKWIKSLRKNLKKEIEPWHKKNK